MLKHKHTITSILIICISLALISACNKKDDKTARTVIELSQHYTTLEEKRVSFIPVPITSDIVITSLDQPQNGDLTNQGLGSYEYRPWTEFSGQEVLHFELSDGRTGTITFDVQAVNDSPVAIADVATILGNTAVTLPVLENDVDLDSDDLTIVAVGTPDRGSVVDNDDGTLTYTPPDQFTGKVEFSYTVSDGEFNVDALVTIFALSELSLITNPRMDPENTQLREGATAHLHALGDTTLQGTLELSNLMQWTSSDAGIVEIGANPGTILAKAPGTATITAKVGTAEVDEIVVQGKVTVIPKRPATPGGFAITQFAGEGVNTPTIQVSWTINAGLTYNLYSKPEDGLVKVIPGAKPPFLDKGLTVGKVYQYWVSAINDGGESIPSKQLALRVKAPEVLEPATPPISKVDLEITNVQIDKTAGDIHHGENIQVTFVVRNNGALKYSSAWNSQFKVGITMDPDPEPRGHLMLNYYEDQPHLTTVIDSLEPGQSLEKTVTYQVARRFGTFLSHWRGAGVGEYYLRVIADSTNLERESNENNNEYVVPVKFNVVEDDNEDLTVTAFTASTAGTPIGTGTGQTATLTVNDPIHIDYTVANIGSSDTGGHYIVFYLVTESLIPPFIDAHNIKTQLESSSYIGYARIDGVSAQGEIQGSIDTFVPYYLNGVTEPHKLVAYVDRWGDDLIEQVVWRFGRQKEADEYNNVRIIDTPIVINATSLSGPNLVMTDFKIVGDKTSLLEHEQFAVEYSVANQGDMTTRTKHWTTRGIFADAEFSTGWYFLNDILPELAPGASIARRVSAVSNNYLTIWVDDTSTQLTLTGNVDPFFQQVESNHDDNSQILSLAISHENNIDFTITDVTLLEGNSVTAGEQLPLSYTVTNAGSTMAWPSAVGFHLGDYVVQRYVPAMPAGASATEQFKIQVPTGLPVDTELTVHADDYDGYAFDVERSDTYDEVDENNNSQTVPLNIQPSPLVLSEPELAAQFSPGQKSTVQVTVTNSGTIHSQGAVARVVFHQNCTDIDKEKCGWVFLNSVRIPPLPASESATKDIDFKIPYNILSANPHGISVQLVALNTDFLIDTIPKDNVTITDDLNLAIVAGSLQYSATPVGIDISATVANLSNFVSSADDTPLTFCLVSNSEAQVCLPGSEIIIAHIPRIAPGQNFVIQQQAPLRNMDPGSYFLMAKLEEFVWHNQGQPRTYDTDTADNISIWIDTPIVVEPAP